ncbi:tRNA1(Val) (adenine(37)-N6)-methyltransferase [Pseudoalteromonas sp. A25]|uniref:tRNA1(Val) (adenine(37)-N6)-methyltransferase n=1 Tax=Pseudoalteromonas sp. A25 TaxID=116092 RepID=UPI0012604E11|nr:methyltransferase [Pseudoalteromonas sp. A25]BBN80722.1 tRNA1(Val) (adenine(37)-N6)-methyltransferase [Pseudoalteromonas sp. A25]
MSGFAFKQFKVQQSNTAMKVSTDGILLGAWTNLSEAKRLLDIGCGTGLLSLMCKQRVPNLEVEAVEIDEGAYEDAFANIWHSPWPDIQLHQGDIRTFNSTDLFDVVICNPPYFNGSLKGPNQARNTARHTDSLPFGALINAFTRLSHPGSRLALILPCTEAEQFKSLGESEGLVLQRECLVATTEYKSPTRSLLEFGYDGAQLIATDSLCIQRSDGGYSAEFIALCRDFYVKM